MTAHEYLTERSAIAEYDGGLPRADADRLAATQLIGEPEFTRGEKIAGLAKYLADMPNNDARRHFLIRFAYRHGDAVAAELRSATWDEIRRRGRA